MYLAKSPWIVRLLAPPNLIWRVPVKEKTVYLTFDDGPVPEVTPKVLAILNAFGVKATFFCVGENVQKHPDIFQMIKDNHHAVGNHTFNHLNGFKTEDETYFANIEKCHAFVNSQYFRPPYGRIKRQQVKMLSQKFKIVTWTVISGDFDKNTSVDKCISNVMSAVCPGAVIVFHDSIKAQENMLQAVPMVIQNLSRQGYSFSIFA